MAGEAAPRKYVYCDQCGTPVAEVVDGRLVIVARHHSERHVTVLPPRRQVNRRGGLTKPPGPVTV